MSRISSSGAAGLFRADRVLIHPSDWCYIEKNWQGRGIQTMGWNTLHHGRIICLFISIDKISYAMAPWRLDSDFKLQPDGRMKTQYDWCTIGVVNDPPL